ncbi:MAG: hypothetical protein NW701_19770 [Nitrospira sp.]
MKGIWWPGLLCALLAGCVAIGSPELADEKAMDRITVGETTKADIVTFLGPPAERRSIEIGHATKESWSYSYASATINPLEYLLLYGLWTNGIGLFDTRYDLFLSFDYKGVVSGLSLLKTSYDMGSPVRSTHVTAVADNTIGVAGPTGRTVRFVDRVDYRAE